MRINDVYKRAYNRCLATITEAPIGSDLGTESGLAAALGVSRTTVRNILKAMAQAGIIAVRGRRKLVRRQPRPADRFPETETESVRTIVEKGFMDLVLYRDIRPGQQISTLDLARQFSVSTSAVREYLTDFSRCGLLERRPNSSWVFRGFDLAFARELSHVRELFEVDSAVRFAELPLDGPLWQTLTRIEAEHIALLGKIDEEYTKFSRLDDSFHNLIMSVSRNRFMDSFHDLLRMVFHYHYQWRKTTEKQRNIIAVQEHLAYITALRSRDRDAIRVAAVAHLRTARQSLIESIERNAERAQPTEHSDRSST